MDTSVSHLVSPVSPSRRSAHSDRCCPGTCSNAATTKARRPLTVSRSAIRATNASMVSTARGLFALGFSLSTIGASAMRRSTRFTSSLPTVASVASRRRFSTRASASSSNLRRARSRACSSSSGPSSSSSSSMRRPRRRFSPFSFFTFSFRSFFTLSFSSFFLPLLPPTRLPSSSISSSSSSESDSSSSSSSSLRSSGSARANTSSNSSPGSPVMMCSACRAARQPVSIAPPTVSGCSLQVCSPANSSRPPLEGSGRPISS
mmetsp:Transcript_35808/g.88153  ORF Transcript_35808/g.88153 Transcript_35808/m.88153 type:complete len:261 (-) Transcript_35808:189-971(-)